MASRRGGMSPAQRAKQFMPFAAVKGLDEALEKKRRELTRVEKIELSEEMSQALDRMLRSLRRGDFVAVTWYAEGSYRTLTGELENIDPVGHRLCVAGQKVTFDDLLRVEPIQKDKGEEI